jgi:hypothetical protein
LPRNEERLHTKKQNMNTNTNKWAVEVGNANLSEAIQTIAFSYGYVWAGSYRNEKKVSQLSAKFLVFTPSTMTITYSDSRFEVELAVNQVVTSFDSVMNLFKSPPAVSVKVGSDITVNKTGDVSLKTFVIPSGLFDQVVTARNTLLGKKNKLPVVRFTYTSQNSGRKTRNVMVTEMTEDAISGLDMDADNKFKKFLVGKVGAAGVQLLSFVDEP